MRYSDAFHYGKKVQAAREEKRPSITRQRLAEMAVEAGLPDYDYHTIERIEMGRSEKKARELIPFLVQWWGIPEAWFWDGRNPEPDGKFSTSPVNEQISEYDVLGGQVDIVLHVATKSGKVILLSKGSGKTSVPTGLAKGNEFAIRVADAENAPRFLPGNVVIFRPRDIYDDRCYVAAENPAEQVEGPDGEMYPRVYIRWHVYEDGRFQLKPRDPAAQTFDANSLRIVGMAIGRKIEYSEDGYDLEIWHRGLPWDRPG